MFCGFSKQKKYFYNELNNIYEIEKIKSKRREKEKPWNWMSFQLKQGYGMYALGNMADLQLSSWYIAL